MNGLLAAPGKRFFFVFFLTSFMWGVFEVVLEAVEVFVGEHAFVVLTAVKTAPFPSVALVVSLSSSIP